ncbi:hypothetical protein ACFYUR_30605 [Micromonospora haikouensis]|uniref:hypothetical protein n=1 Tax=Micromonospora haikouensis TaxID=686309 RepID=UPI003694A01F
MTTLHALATALADAFLAGYGWRRADLVDQGGLSSRSGGAACGRSPTRRWSPTRAHPPTGHASSPSS